MTMRDLGDLTIYAGAVAAALAAIAGVLRYALLRPLKRWIAEQVSEPLREVRTEVKPNRGQSLKDAVDRTELKVGELALQFARHLGDHAGGGAR